MRNVFALPALKKMRTVLFALLLVLTACLPLGCEQVNVPNPSDLPTDTVSSATASRFRASEIREFQGTFLSPAIGPRDNSIAGIQQVDISQYQLSIDGLVDNPQKHTYDEVIALTSHQRLIRLFCVEGWDATILWQGVLLNDLFQPAGVKAEAVTVIFHGVDGYTTSLPLDVVKDRQLILAYMANGLPLPAEMGYPFIVVAEDRFGYKWARWVERIELSSEQYYRGYWESFGYSIDGEIR